MCYDYRPVPFPFVCRWCGHPAFTAVGPLLFDLGCYDGPSTADNPGVPVGLLPVLFNPALGDQGWPMFPCPLGGLVEGTG